MTLSFTVSGLPAGAGSKRAFPIKKAGVFTGKVAVVDSSGEKGKNWRQDVRAAAYEAMAALRLAPFDEPLILRIEFVMPRPKSHFRTGKNSHLMRLDAPTVHSIAPDATKLTRAVEDALNLLAWRDDSLVCEQIILKTYGDQPGARVTVTPWAEENVLRQQLPQPQEEFHLLDSQGAR